MVITKPLHQKCPCGLWPWSNQKISFQFNQLDCVFACVIVVSVANNFFIVPLNFSKQPKKLIRDYKHMLKKQSSTLYTSSCDTTQLVSCPAGLTLIVQTLSGDTLLDFLRPKCAIQPKYWLPN